MAGFVFAKVPGRGRDVENDLRSRCRQTCCRVAPVAPLAPEILVIPDILANGQTDGLAFELERKVFDGGLKVAILVEHVISRQQGFASGGKNLPILAKSG